MARTPQSERKVPVAPAVTTSANLPQPSTTRINIAQAPGQGIAQLGEVFERIGLAKQAADDKIELDSATIDLTNNVQSIIDTNAQNIQDPKQFETTTNKQLQSLLKSSEKGVGLRNRGAFSVISQNIAGRASSAIAKAKTAKVLDIAKAQKEVINRNVLGQAASNIAAGVPNAEQLAITQYTSFLTDQFDKGLISAKDLAIESFKVRKDLVQIRVDTLLTQGKSDEALNVLATTTVLDPAEKLELRYKNQGRINKADSENNKKFKAELEVIEAQYDELAIRGELPETSDTGLSIESLRASKLKPEDKRRIFKKNQEVIDIGGIGDQELTNQLRSDIADDIPDNPIIDNAYISQLQDNGEINNKQALQLRADIKAKANDLEGRRSTPDAKANRTSIKRLYRASGITGSSLLRREAITQLDRTLEVYEAGLDQGMSPRDAKVNAFKIVGNPPRVTEVSEAELTKLREDFIRWGKQQQELTDSGERRTPSQIEEFERRKKNFEEDINEMQEQIRIKKEIDDFVKAGTRE